MDAGKLIATRIPTAECRRPERANRNHPQNMFRSIRWLAIFLCLPCVYAQRPALTTEGRLQIHVPADAPALKDVRSIDGRISDGSWLEDPEARERLTDLVFPVHWWRWKQVKIHFVPAHDGDVELMLGGVWKEAGPGVLEQLEVYWDDITAEGTTMENGDFESPGDGPPASWNSPWRPYPDPDQWPLSTGRARNGTGFGASWHGRPLARSLKVKRDQPVTLTLHARAAVPPAFKMPVVQSPESPAHRANAKLKRGVNLGNCWEAPPGGGWKIQYTPEDVDRIASEGFDHIRVPVGWHHFLRGDRIDATLLEELEPVLRRAMEKNLMVVLNWHHFDDICREPEKHRDTFVRGWDTVARHFKDWPDSLILELLNEPYGALDGDLMASVYRDALRSIRRTNPERITMVNPSQWSTAGALDRLFLPDDDPRIIVSIHCYDPFQFTHQGASWVDLTELRNVVYPGPPDTPLPIPASLRGRPDLIAWIEAYNTRKGPENPSHPAVIRRTLDDAFAWSSRFGRPVHLGEFGAHRLADAASRARYSRDVRRAAENRGIPWALWDWKAGFAYWDPEAEKPLLRDALFGD